ncbi:MAG: hypothetical protein IJZ83_09775 [Clostridia bacterium]|nr:hypothetical protein [Clostridia bacterium]
MRAENARKEDINSNIRPLAYRRAFGIIIPLCLAALMLGGAIISVGNDIYAFVKPDEDISVVIAYSTPSNELSELLQRQGVIKNAFAFNLYLRSKGKGDDALTLSGEWTLNSNMSYREILAELF